MKSVSKRYLYIFKKYYSDRAKDRCLHLIEYAHYFIESLQLPIEDYLIDEARLIKSVDSYFLDVIKYKEYHFSPPDTVPVNSDAYDKYVHSDKKINDSKVASFTAKWLLKCSPLFVLKKSSAEYNELVHYINELFALNCAIYALLQEDFHLLDNDEIEKLFYDFRFRTFDDRAYFSRFDLIEKLVSIKKNTPLTQDKNT